MLTSITVIWGGGVDRGGTSGGESIGRGPLNMRALEGWAPEGEASTGPLPVALGKAAL